MTFPRTRIPRSGISHQPNRWTAEEIRALGVTTDVVTAGAILQIGRTSAYKLAQDGEFPLPVIRAGSQYRVPVAHILQLLGLDKPQQEPA